MDDILNELYNTYNVDEDLNTINVNNIKAISTSGIVFQNSAGSNILKIDSAITCYGTLNVNSQQVKNFSDIYMPNANQLFIKNYSGAVKLLIENDNINLYTDLALHNHDITGIDHIESTSIASGYAAFPILNSDLMLMSGISHSTLSGTDITLHNVKNMMIKAPMTFTSVSDTILTLDGDLCTFHKNVNFSSNAISGVSSITTGSLTSISSAIISLTAGDITTSGLITAGNLSTGNYFLRYEGDNFTTYRYGGLRVINLGNFLDGTQLAITQKNNTIERDTCIFDSSGKIITNAHVYPSTTSTYSSGTDTNRWSSVNTVDASVSGELDFPTVVSGDYIIKYASTSVPADRYGGISMVNLGSSTDGHQIRFVQRNAGVDKNTLILDSRGRIVPAGDLYPSITNTYSSGTSSNRWSSVNTVDINASGTTTVDALNAGATTCTSLSVSGNSVKFDYSEFKLTSNKSTPGKIVWDYHSKPTGSTVSHSSGNIRFAEAGYWQVNISATFYGSSAERICTIKFESGAVVEFHVGANTGLVISNDSTTTPAYANASLSWVGYVSTGKNYYFVWESSQDNSADIHTWTHATLVRLW